MEDLWHCLTICCRYCSKATRLVSRTLGVEFRIFLGGNSQQFESSRYLLRSCKINVVDKIRDSLYELYQLNVGICMSQACLSNNKYLIV